LDDDQIQSLAATSHGYVGADLSAVCREAGLKCINRLSVDENWSKTRDIKGRLTAKAALDLASTL
jgi:SpoVK/Ycf46/Vps4 family AAA+-type ATPase